MVTVGAITYSGVVMVLIAGTSGVASWHDIWLFATMTGILPIGAVLLLAGLVVLGFATRRSEIVPAWASIGLRIGAAINLVAFFTAIPLSLPIGAAILGSALVACGWAVSRKPRMPGHPKVATAVPAFGVSRAPIHRFVTPPRPIL
jgi:hypothetical protein